jgi:hypothetical protein
MRRKILSLASATSSLLCIAVVVIWARSYRGDEQIPFSYHRLAYRLLIRSGSVAVDNQPEIVAQTEREERARQAIALVPGAAFLFLVPGGAAVAMPASHVPPPWSRSSRIPLPAASVLLAVAPLYALVRRWKRRNRFARGLCLNCAYDLTGNTSGACPECGTAVAGKAV